MFKNQANILVNMKILWPLAMRLLHGGIEKPGIVQSQHWAHVCVNKATGGCSGWPAAKSESEANDGLCELFPPSDSELR